MWVSSTNLEVTAMCYITNQVVKFNRIGVCCLLLSHLVVGFDGAQLHHELEAQQVIGADGLKLQEFA